MNSLVESTAGTKKKTKEPYHQSTFETSKSVSIGHISHMGTN